MFTRTLLASQEETKLLVSWRHHLQSASHTCHTVKRNERMRMTLKNVTTKTMAITMIAGAAVLGTGTIASASTTAPVQDTAAVGTSAGETSTSTAKPGAASANTDSTSAQPEAEKKFSSIGTFLNHYKGESLANSQGGFQGECVSLISRALEEVHGVDHGPWGNAVDYQAGGSGGQQMKNNGFTWHTDQKFENGDILVWGDGADTGVYGHIGIYYEGQVWHQNFNNDRSLHTYDGLIDGYLGYWRA